MGSLSWKTWAVVTLLALGLCFEIFKHMPMGRRLLTDTGSIQTTPYSVGENRARRSAPIVVKQATYTPPIGQATVPATKTNESSAEENKGEAGKVAGEVKKKKKKKKKKKSNAETETTEEDFAQKNKSQDDEETKWPTPASSPAAQYTTAVPPNSGAKEDEPMSADEWFKILATRTDAETLEKFIDAYRERSIGADVFYQVVGRMLDEKNEVVQTNALMALSRTSSVASFLMLADVARDQSAPQLHAKADAYLASYADLSGINVLHSILSGSDSVSATLVATRELGSAIEKYSKGTSTQGGGGNTSPRYQPQYLQRYFRPFVPILTTLSGSKDPSIAAQASQTLASLQSFLASLSSTSTTTTTADNDQGQ